MAEEDVHSTHVKGPELRTMGASGASTRRAKERVDTGDGEGGRDKGHSRGQIPCSPPAAELLFFSRFFFFFSFFPLSFSLLTWEAAGPQRLSALPVRRLPWILWVAPLQKVSTGPYLRAHATRHVMPRHFFFFLFSLFLDRSIEKPSLGVRWSCGSCSALSLPPFQEVTRGIVASTERPEHQPLCVPRRGYQLKDAPDRSRF